MLPCSQSTMTQSTPDRARRRETFAPGSICHMPMDWRPWANAVLRRLDACIAMARRVVLKCLLLLLLVFRRGTAETADDGVNDALATRRARILGPAAGDVAEERSFVVVARVCRRAFMMASGTNPHSGL